MKFNFKKISAIGASLLLTGLTMGVAAAASYPEPFVSGGVADVAIVYGSGAYALDGIPAKSIQDELATHVSGSLVASGENVYQFEKTSTKLHLGDHYVNITTTLDDDSDELPVLLAAGKFIDNDKDEFDYTQKIVMGALGQLTMFDDNDYKADTPTVGFRIPASQNILTYTLTFSDTPLMSDLPTSNLPLMGKNYYVLSNTTTTLTLLDSAETAILSEGETATIDGKVVSIEYIGSTEVKLNIDGETTASLAEAQTQKLKEGSYIGIKDILYNAVQGADNKVEFSIGSGKLKLTDGGSADVQINDNSVSGVVADFSLSGDTLTSINITWSAEDDSFVTDDSDLTMPGFEIVKLSYGGLTYPTEEVIEVQQGGTTYATLNDFPLKDGVKDIDFLYGDSTSFTALGKDASNVFVTDANKDGNITFDKDTDAYFVVSWTDTKDAESYLMKANGFTTDSSSIDRVDIEYWSDGAWVKKKASAKATDTLTIGSIGLTLGAVSNSGNSVEIWNSSANTATSITSFNTLYSKEGMTLYLPWVNSTATNITNTTTYSTAALACAALGLHSGVGEIFTGTLAYNSSTLSVSTTACATSWTLNTIEEDRTGAKYSGDAINLTLGWDSSTTAEVEVSDVVGEEVTFAEIGSTKVERSFMYSALATEILWNKPSTGQKSVKLIYHGDEVAGDAYISSADATMAAGEIGTVLYTDAETASYKEKNVIVVGGSCINAAAAALVGGRLCEGAWTTATGVGSGQYIIKGYATSSITSKFALLVAGYNAADTVNAATYLRTQNPDLSAQFIGPQ
ncbi:MAG: hypothetical protein KJ566_00110 [Nanoarchaeota archaeon]|nr:hypothetical protein [Nanoarchaeota archaeon]